MSCEPELTLVMAEKRNIAAGVLEIEFRHPDGQALPPWEPGAHVDVVLPNGITRQYSLCGNPGDRGGWRIAVLREPDSRGGTAYLHDVAAEQDRLLVRGPRNHFRFEPSPRYLFIAGGIGITPIIPMAEAAERTGAEWRLLYGGRTRLSMAYLDRLEELPRNRTDVRPQEEFGLLDLAAFLGAADDSTLVYCCGPEPLLLAAEEQCRVLTDRALRVERFAPRATDSAPAARAFRIELSRTGSTLVVPPDRSILEVLREAGIQVPTSCEEGTCGTCETALLEGAGDHRDSVMSPAEREANNTIFICVSRALSERLVLDL
jgi:ferredoxin-NADP reductase